MKGKIGNFEYLMILNTLSGRSFNDIAQYPIVPWIYKDYDSDYLSLHDPDYFRDLTLPMGAIKESRRKDITERYNDMVERNMDVDLMEEEALEEENQAVLS